MLQGEIQISINAISGVTAGRFVWHLLEALDCVSGNVLIVAPTCEEAAEFCIYPPLREMRRRGGVRVIGANTFTVGARSAPYQTVVLFDPVQFPASLQGDIAALARARTQMYRDGRVIIVQQDHTPERVLVMEGSACGKTEMPPIVADAGGGP